MREYRSSEAMAHLPDLLDAVERGETIIITRRGRRVARLVPDVSSRRERTQQVFAEHEDLRRTMPTLSLDEVLDAESVALATLDVRFAAAAQAEEVALI